MKSNEVLLTVKEVSNSLKINVNSVYTLIHSGQLRAIKLGRLKVPKFELDRFLIENLGKEVVC